MTLYRQIFTSLKVMRRGPTMPTSNDIDTRVAKVLVQALGVDECDVKPAATLQGDLGAESIDFLDIVFRLEREFTIKIPQGELFSELLVRAGTEILHDGRVTDLGMATLRAQLPYADLTELERDRRLNRIDDLFTVGLLSSYITRKLDGRRGSDHVLAAHHSPVDLPTSVVSTGI
jgi:acyl carrier protein